MASSSAPKHDFAPAWLKIPTNAQKPSGAGSGDTSVHNEDSVVSLNSHVISKSRNSSVDVRRDRCRSSLPYRHHSIDTDDPQHLSPTASEYRLSSSQRHQSGSQPSLGRRPLSRQDFRDSLSPSFSQTSKNFGSGASDSHRSSGNHWSRQRSFEHNQGNGSNKSSAAEVNHSSAKESSSWNETKINKFDQEFPSLKGGKAEDVAPSTNVVNGSVWDTSKTGKIHLSSSVNKKLHLVQKPIRNDIAKRSTSPGGSVVTGTGNGSPKSVPHATVLKQVTKSSSASLSSSSSVYRTLLPVKGAMIRRPSRENAKSNGPSSKSGSRSSPTPSASEILNTRLVTHPKNLGNKSDFLKELRDDGSSVTTVKIGDDSNDLDNELIDQEAVVCSYEKDRSHKSCPKESRQDRPDLSLNKLQNGVSEHEEDTKECNCLQNSFLGINIERTINTEHADSVALSRSLEAEQRLLREMGWTEESSEDGVYAPLTEAEMKEIESLSKTIPKRNGFQRNQQFTWSPKRIFTFPKAVDLADESSGSTSTDSDSD